MYISLKDLDERELKEIEFARMYYKKFNHGTSGHNALVIIAKLMEKIIEHNDREDRDSPLWGDERS